MKNSIYAIVLFCITFVSCEKAELTDVTLFDTVNTNAADADTRSNSSSTKIKEELCIYSPMVNSLNQIYGWMYITVSHDFVKVNYQLNKGWTFSTTSLEVLDCTDPTTILGLNMPQANEFTYYTSHKKGLISEFAYKIKKEDFNPISCYAAQASIVSAKGEQFVLWAETWASFISVDLSACGTWPEYSEACFSAGDTEFYIPLSQEASGRFPNSGSTSDVVTLTPESPISEGYVTMDLNFSNLPEDLDDIMFSIEFYDLDLHPDVITAGSNVITFEETFTLSNDENEVIAFLDKSSVEDGSFVYTVELDDALIKNNYLALNITYTSRLELISGHGINIGNTSEEMFNISVCGIASDESPN